MIFLSTENSNNNFRYFFMAVSGRVLVRGPAIPGVSSLPGGEIFELPPGPDGLSLETGDCQGTHSYRSSDSGGQSSGRSSPAAEGPVQKKRRSTSSFPKIILEERIEKMFRKYPCTPINNLCATNQWLGEADFRYIRDNNPKYQTVMDVISSELTQFSIRQFMEMFEKPGASPLFAMPNGVDERAVIEENEKGEVVTNIYPYYLSLEKSLEICSQLLEFQTNGQVRKFLVDLVNVLDRRKPKENTIHVYAPPTSGKNFFFDAILNFFLNRGQMGNQKKGENFPYMDLVRRRVVLWDEPNMAESEGSIDTLKMLFGGYSCPVNVKFRAPVMVSRTPIFLLTNDPHLFKKVEAFEDRVLRYTWKKAPFLKPIKSLPTPLVLPALLTKYNVPF